MSNARGTLYLVGTPIGNLGDITIRALETLKSVDLIAAEDTRQTLKLLNHFNIQKPLKSYHEHNKVEKGQMLVQELLEGKSIALVSDAGMPGISDPGSDMVKVCINEGIDVSIIPGPSAFVTGLIGSGLDTKGFIYSGFFPRSKKEINNVVKELNNEKRTIIFYESPRRIVNTVNVIYQNWGDRYCCIARELTKVHEEYLRGRLSEVIDILDTKNIKGEITLIVEGYKEDKKKEIVWEDVLEHMQELINEGESRKDAIKMTAKYFKLPKRELYNKVMKEESTIY